MSKPEKPSLKSKVLTKNVELARHVVGRWPQWMRDFARTALEIPASTAVPKSLDDAINIQCSHGNWNYDAYMHGMANGMIFARSCITDEDPKYLKAPKTWLIDKGESL